MNYFQNLFFITLNCFLVFSCSSGKQGKVKETSKTAQSASIEGTWTNVSMSITFQDNDSVFNVPKGEWEKILKIKPIVTTYLPDATYESRYYNLDDSLLFTSSGSWYLKDDSLYLTTAGSTSSYHFSTKDGVGRFTGIIDWDEDGNANELYDGKQLKIQK